MAKKAMIEREKKRQRLVEKYAAKRLNSKKSQKMKHCRWKSASKRA
jgi:hypothetical protein